MAFWYTWLGYLGLVSGLIAAAIFGWPPLRTATIGFTGGVAAVILANLVSPVPPPCLQNAKGMDILRAYSLDCTK